MRKNDIQHVKHVLPFGEEMFGNIRRLLSNATVSVRMAHILFGCSVGWIRVSPVGYYGAVRAPDGPSGGFIPAALWCPGRASTIGRRI